MKLLYTKVTNFASYREETFNFDDIPNLVAIIGSNGGGKSTFFVEALTISLFNRARGTTTLGGGLEHFITTGEDRFEIETAFEINEQTIKVIRRRFLKGGQELELYIDGIDHTDKIKETQAKILNIIKMDYDTFIDTVVIKQGSSGTFMAKPANERKDVFTQILNLDKYEVLKEYTKELRKEKKRKIDDSKEDLTELEDSIKLKVNYTNAITEGTKETKFITSEITNKEDELEMVLSEKATHDQLLKQRNEILKRQQILKDKVSSTNDSISKGTLMKEKSEIIISTKKEVFLSLSTSLEQVEEISDKLSQLNSEKNTLEGTNNVLRKQAKELKAKHDRMKEFNEASCNFCGQMVTEDHRQKHLQELFAEASSYIKQIKVNEISIQQLDVEINDLNQQSSQLKSTIRDLQSQKSQIEQAEVKYDNIVSRLEELEEELIITKKDYDEVMEIQVFDVENKIFNDSSLRMEINSLRQNLNSWNGKIAVAENELKKISKDEGKIVNLEKEIKEMQSEYSQLDDLVKAWGKDGIQAIIIDNALPEIEDEINEILKLLTNGQVTIEFITQKEKGKGKNSSSIETLDIIVIDQDGSRVYETYSGGEKFRVDFACHVGLSKYLSKRAGAAIDFFIVDEGVGSQDQMAKESFVTVMNKISTIFDKVMIITHIEDIIESFPDRVEVYKDPVLGSKIKIL